LTLREEEEGNLRVFEPDYYGDALRGLNRTLDTTLEVATEQAELLRGEGVDGLDARFDQYFVAWPHAFDSPDIFLRRSLPERDDNSGWFVGDLARLGTGTPDDVIEPIPVFKMLSLHRSAMQVLALPPGYTVVLRDATVEFMASE